MSLENSNANQPLNPTSVATVYLSTVINTAIAIVPAAANVNGCILHRATLDSLAFGNFALIHKNTPPTSIIDGTLIETGTHHSINAATGVKLQMTKDIVVPAGRGIFLISDSVLPVFGNVQVTNL